MWERRSHSISYVGTPFPCVPVQLHHCTSLHGFFICAASLHKGPDVAKNKIEIFVDLNIAPYKSVKKS